MKRSKCYRWLMIGALMLAAGLGLDGLWIHAKAALAQLLLARAWARSDHGREARPPWPWADMALITVRRASSTRQSEYTKPERRSPFRPALYSRCGKPTAFEPGSVMRPPRWS